MEFFKGPITSRVLKVLSHINILLQSTPANLVYLFQLLDAQGGPTRFANQLMKKKFTDWYAVQMTKAMSEGPELQYIDIPLKLSIVKLLHAKRLIEMYNETTSVEGRLVFLKG